uniref:Uncharacterized protein n=1 Tax=Heliothis virescens TaxID=7102 RepID=A0A2A4JPH2_HELVI
MLNRLSIVFGSDYVEQETSLPEMLYFNYDQSRDLKLKQTVVSIQPSTISLLQTKAPKSHLRKRLDPMLLTAEETKTIAWPENEFVDLEQVSSPKMPNLPLPKEEVLPIQTAEQPPLPNKPALPHHSAPGLPLSDELWPPHTAPQQSLVSKTPHLSAPELQFSETSPPTSPVLRHTIGSSTLQSKPEIPIPIITLSQQTGLATTSHASTTSQYNFTIATTDSRTALD